MLKNNNPTKKGRTFMDTLHTLEKTIAGRRETPKPGSYTNYLFEKGIDKILKKVGEEAAEVIIASKNTNREDFLGEAADLLYHLFVLLNEKGIAFDDVLAVLEDRREKE